MNNRWFQLLRFSLVGGLNTLVDLGIFFLGVWILSLPPWAAQSASYAAGLTNSWIWNSRWVFTQTSSPKIPWNRLPRFLLVNLGLLTSTAIFLHWTVDSLQWPVLYSKLGITVLGVGLNFLLMKRFVFAYEPGTPAEKEGPHGKDSSGRR